MQQYKRGMRLSSKLIRSAQVFNNSARPSHWIRQVELTIESNGLHEGGGFGDVIFDSFDGKPAAIKHFKHVTSENFVETALYRMRLCGHQPSLVQAYAFGHTKDGGILITKKYDHTISSLLKVINDEERESSNWMTQLCNCVM